jgi:hypothetical protein
MRYLISRFGIDRVDQILFVNDPASSVDIEIRVGRDALNIIP